MIIGRGEKFEGRQRSSEELGLEVGLKQQLLRFDLKRCQILFAKTGNYS
jgi:hypothetical protein